MTRSRSPPSVDPTFDPSVDPTFDPASLLALRLILSLEHRFTMSQSPIPPNPSRPQGDSSALARQAPEHQGGLVPQSSSSLAVQHFDQPVILRQSPWVPQLIIGTIVGVTSFTIAWACIAQVDEAIPAQGKLEPAGSVQPVQAPVGGVVQTIEVAEGDRVEAGTVLIRFDQTTAQAQQTSLEQIRQSLDAENQYYRSQMASGTTSALDPTPTNISPEAAALTANRAALMAENNLYRAMLGDSAVYLSLAEQQRLSSFQAERESRVAAAQSRVEQVLRQSSQVQVQLTSTANQLQVNQEILDRILPLAEDGGIAQIQVLRQQQEVDTAAAEYDRLLEEQKRLQFAVSEAQETLANTQAVSTDDILTRIATNDQRLADIDSQLSKVILENEKQIQDLDSQLSQTRQTLTYQELRAPVAGTVFDLQPTGPGFVANTSEPILKIVPDDTLIAQVFITNQDIGFVNTETAQPEVDVRIDSFPYSEFGDVKGKLVKVGSDVLPPDEIYPFYRFPAEVSLDRQFIPIEGQEIMLQSGMSVSVNIKTRKRPVITFITDLFVRKLDTLRSRS